MNDKDYFRKLWDELPIGRSGCFTPIAISVFVGVLFMLCSCATRHSVEYVDREIVKYETKVQHDTLINNIHDSVYHTVFQKGDTIYDTKYVEKTKWRDRVVYKIDTCYKDSISVQVRKSTVEVQKNPKWCYYCLVFCVLFAIFALRKLILWIGHRV